MTSRALGSHMNRHLALALVIALRLADFCTGLPRPRLVELTVEAVNEAPNYASLPAGVDGVSFVDPKGKSKLDRLPAELVRVLPGEVGNGRHTVQLIIRVPEGDPLLRLVSGKQRLVLRGWTRSPAGKLHH